jgi:hypothetical protein
LIVLIGGVMLKYIIPKAILMGFMIDFGGYIGVNLIFNIAIIIFNSMIKLISFIPTDTFVEAVSGSLLINISMNIICFSIVLFGNYQSARMAKNSEWLNSMIAFGVSLTISLVMGWNVNLITTLCIVLIATIFASAGTYLAVIKNKLELLEEKR